MTEPSLKEFARWAQQYPAWRIILQAIVCLADNRPPEDMVYVAKLFCTKPNWQGDIPEFIQVLAQSAPGAEAEAVKWAREMLLDEVREFTRGEAEP